MINILIADDNLEFVKSFSNYLSYICEDIRIVNISTNGLEIMQELKRNCHIDIILLDLDMPILNGIEFLKNISYLNLKDCPKIIVLSGEILKYENIQNDKNIYLCLNKANGFSMISEEIRRVVKEISNERIEQKIRKELKYIGMNLNHVGTKYLTEAILEVYRNPDIGYNLEKNIYTKISKRERKSVSTIKSNILKAINYMYVENEFEKIKVYFSMQAEEKPTPKCMVFTIIDKIK